MKKDLSIIIFKKIRFNLAKIEPDLFKNSAGFTKGGLSLIEMMVYIAILSAVILLFVNLLISVSKSYIVIKMERELDSSAISSLDRMTREIRNASSIDAVSVLSLSPGKLVLNGVDSLGNTRQVIFDVETSQLYVSEDGISGGSLFSSGVTVSNLIFREIDTGISKAIKIEMTLENKDGNIVRGQKYYSTIILRGSY